MIEPVEEKRNTALSLGADYAIHPFEQDICEESMKITEGRGFDVVIESSGIASAIASSYAILGRDRKSVV